MKEGVRAFRIMGTLKYDPEWRSTAEGTDYLLLTLSVPWRYESGNETKEGADEYRVKIYREHTAKNAGKYLDKGDGAYIEGTVRSYKTQGDNREFLNYELVGSNVTFL